MGKPSVQNPVKLIASIIFREERSLVSAEKTLVKLYGAVESVHKIFPFDYTDYYRGEMGGSLARKLVCFKKLFSKDDMPGIKRTTNRIEDRYSLGGRRTVNIDPGYVTEAKLVLLTTKDYSHRIYIGKQIFAECTLSFQGGTFRPWSWTYPDYASAGMVGYFNEVREMYMRDLKSKRKSSCVLG